MFRASPANRPVRIISGIVAACFSLLALGMEVSPFVALAPAALGFGYAVYHAVMMWRERPDPYDLSKLWITEEPPQVPDEDNVERELTYCHHCGASMPDSFAICPQCGTPLGR